MTCPAATYPSFGPSTSASHIPSTAPIAPTTPPKTDPWCRILNDVSASFEAVAKNMDTKSRSHLMADTAFDELIVRMRQIKPLAEEILSSGDEFQPVSLENLAKSCVAIANCSLSTETTDNTEDPTSTWDTWEDADEDA